MTTSTWEKFYDEFRRRRVVFLEQLGDTRDEHERAARASVLLNRLMFVYFLQSGGFIKGHAARADYRYLQNGLKRSRARGEGLYHAEFLRALFFEGFAKPEHARAPRGTSSRATSASRRYPGSYSTASTPSPRCLRANRSEPPAVAGGYQIMRPRPARSRRRF